MREDYDALGARWSKIAARLVYDATPAMAWDGVFWTSMAAQLGRTHDAVYKQLCVRWGWTAKVDQSLREYEDQGRKCMDCKVAIAGYDALRCRKCSGLARRAANRRGAR